MAVLYTKSGGENEEFENLLEISRFAFEQYNAIHRKNFIFNAIEIDDKDDPDFAEKQLAVLVQSTKPIAIIGPLFSNVALSLKDFADKNKIPMISVFATHNDLTKNSQYVLRICASNNSLIKIMADYLLPQIQKNKLNVTVFKDLSDFYSTDLVDAFKKSLMKSGANINEVMFKGLPGVERLKDINSKVWNPSNHDLLFLGTQDLVSSKILSAMESDPYLLATIDPVNFMNIMKKVKKDKTHIRLISTAQWLPGKSIFSKNIEELFKKKFKREMKTTSALTFDAAYGLAAAFDRSRAKNIPLIEALKDGTKVEGVTGNIALGLDGERVKTTSFIKEDLIQ